MRFLFCLLVLALSVLVLGDAPFAKLKSEIESRRLIEADTLEGLESLLAQEGVKVEDIRGVVIQDHEPEVSQAEVLRQQANDVIQGSFEELRDYLQSQGVPVKTVQEYHQEAMEVQAKKKKKEDLESLQTVRYGTYEELRDYIISTGAQFKDLNQYREELAEAERTAQLQSTAETELKKGGKGKGKGKEGHDEDLQSQPQILRYGTYEELRDYIVSQGFQFKTVQEYHAELAEAERTAQLQSTAETELKKGGGKKRQEPEDLQNQVVRHGSYEELRDYLLSQGLQFKSVQDYQAELAEAERTAQLQAAVETESKKGKKHGPEDIQGQPQIIRTGSYEELLDYVTSQGYDFKSVEDYRVELAEAERKLQAEAVAPNEVPPPQALQTQQTTRTGSYEELRNYLVNQGIQFKTVQEYHMELAESERTAQLAEAERTAQLQAAPSNPVPERRTLQARDVKPEDAITPGTQIYGSFEELRDLMTSRGMNFKTVQDYKQELIEGFPLQSVAAPAEPQQETLQSAQVMQGSYEELRDYLLSHGEQFKDLQSYRTEQTVKEAEVRAKRAQLEAKEAEAVQAFEELQEALQSEGVAPSETVDEYRSELAQKEEADLLADSTVVHRTGTFEELTAYLKAQGLQVRDVNGNLL